MSNAARKKLGIQLAVIKNIDKYEVMMFYLCMIYM